MLLFAYLIVDGERERERGGCDGLVFGFDFAHLDTWYAQCPKMTVDDHWLCLANMEQNNKEKWQNEL